MIRAYIMRVEVNQAMIFSFNSREDMIHIHKGFVLVPNIKGRPKHEKTHENIFDALRGPWKCC